MKVGFSPVNLTAQSYGNAIICGGFHLAMRLQIPVARTRNLPRKQEMMMMEKKLEQMKALQKY